MELAIIVAAAENHVIGRDNGLIWHLSADLKRFKALTTGHAILMGRKTFESMGRALPNRRNVVISGNPGFVAPGAEVVPDIPKALELLKGEERVFVIGGRPASVRWCLTVWDSRSCRSAGNAGRTRQLGKIDKIQEY